MKSTGSSSAPPISSFFCHICADHRELLTGLHIAVTNPSTYQFEKAMKHAGPTSTSTGRNSTLNSGSTAELDHLARKALHEGFLEVERSGSRSLVYQSSNYIGTQFNAATPGTPLNAFRVVLSSASSLGHGYPVSSTQYQETKCEGCGCNVSSNQSLDR